MRVKRMARFSVGESSVHCTVVNRHLTARRSLLHVCTQANTSEARVEFLVQAPLHAKGELFPRQRQGVSCEEDQKLSAETGPEDAETALDHEVEDIVFVDPYDNDGAVDSQGDETPKATGEAAVATTEAAGRGRSHDGGRKNKEFGSAAPLSDRIRSGPAEELHCRRALGRWCDGEG